MSPVAALVAEVVRRVAMGVVVHHRWPPDGHPTWAFIPRPHLARRRRGARRPVRGGSVVVVGE